MEERYERRELDGSTLIYVLNRRPSLKPDEVEGFADSPAVTDSATGNIEEGLLTQSYSIEQPAASPITPSNTTGMPAHSILDGFTLVEPLIFESRQGQPPYALPTQYKHLSSQGKHSTPVTAELTSTLASLSPAINLKTPSRPRPQTSSAVDYSALTTSALRLLSRITSSTLWIIARFNHHSRYPDPRFPTVYQWNHPVDRM